MRIPFLITFFSFFLYNSVFSQQDTLDILFVANWNLGDSYHYKITKSKIYTENDLPAILDSITYSIHVTVIDSSEDGYTVRWQRTSDIKQQLQTQARLADELLYLNYPEIIYKINTLGVFIELVNWKELLRLAKKNVQELKKSITRRENPEEILNENTQLLLDYYTTREGFTAIALREIQSFHYLFGNILTAGEEVLFDTILPNSILGDVIPVQGKIGFEGYNPEENTCVIVEQMITAPETFKNALAKSYHDKDVSESMVNFILDNAVLSAKDINRFEMQYSKGYPRMIEITNELSFDIKIHKIKTMKTLKIELIE